MLDRLTLLLSRCNNFINQYLYVYIVYLNFICATDVMVGRFQCRSFLLLRYTLIQENSITTYVGDVPNCSLTCGTRHQFLAPVLISSFSQSWRVEYPAGLHCSMLAFSDTLLILEVSLLLPTVPLELLR